MSTIIQVSVLPESHHPRVSQNVKHVGESGGVVKSALDYNNCEHSRLQKLHQHQNLTQNHRHHSHQQPEVLPKQLDLSNSDNALLSVYCFIKNFIGAPAGTSTVAIDNKIEQAMDLVKSHLMFAVREEVDVLKEKITELMDRISQLELENGILKANATQETLSQLPPASGTQVNPQMTQQNTQNTQTGTQTLPTNGGQIIRPPNSNQNQTQNNQQTTTS